MQAGSRDRILPALADVLGTYVLPIGAVLLPWPVSFRILRWYADSPRLFRNVAEAAWQSARSYRDDLEERVWKRRFRLLRMVDQVDIYLPLMRSDRWRRKYIVQSGNLPQAATACVFLTYHWGAGNWVWPILRAHGLSAYFLARRPHERLLGATRLSHWYGVFRVWALRRIGSLGVILTGGSAVVVVDALHKGESVVGMLDLSATERQQTLEFPLIGRTARFPVGLARLAVETSARIVIFSFGLDFNNGRRNLRIETLPVGIALEDATRRYIAHLDARLHESTEAWHMWHEAPIIFATQNGADQPIS